MLIRKDIVGGLRSREPGALRREEVVQSLLFGNVADTVNPFGAEKYLENSGSVIPRCDEAPDVMANRDLRRSLCGL